MAQPGSVSCLQSLDLQQPSSSTISAKVSSSPSSTSHIPISLIPGVSTMVTPLGNSNSCLVVVVCLPLESLSLTAPVFITSLPEIAFISVDFPTPDEPISAIVTPDLQYVRRSLIPSCLTALTAYTLTSPAAALTSSI